MKTQQTSNKARRNINQPYSPLQRERMIDDEKTPSVPNRYEQECYEPCIKSYLHCVELAICNVRRKDLKNPLTILCWLPAIAASATCFVPTVICGVSKSCCGFFANHYGSSDDEGYNSDESETTEERFVGLNNLRYPSPSPSPTPYRPK